MKSAMFRDRTPSTNERLIDNLFLELLSTLHPYCKFIKEYILI